ncbi:hypothetical protein BDW74DRAFT_185862 [Aspergillus multicolor]|uniref:uncharacterized protein n=1 Tax=Aspergillus multicolor TaxID=41759 RepID=UPI003CCD6D34
MAGEKNIMLHGICQNEDDPPPAYSPVQGSANSSEISLRTVMEPSLSREFPHNYQVPEGDNAPEGKYSHNDTGDRDSKVLINTSITSRTSAFIEAFMRPRVAPRLINVDSNRAPSGNGGTKNVEGSPVRLKQPPLDIVVMVVKEDIEQFVYIAKHLLQHSHRVRIAADTVCEPLARIQGLDFFPIDNEPDRQTLMDRNHRQHNNSLLETYSQCWRACIAPYYNDPRPFLADAIIATPAAHAHIHCAERLSIPLHIMSATLQTPTKAFSHPHARFSSSEGLDTATANILSYAMVEECTWYTSIKPINQFRQCVLGLRPISIKTAATIVRDYQVPYTYLCSKMLISKPVDWPENQVSIYFMMHEAIDHVSGLLATIIQRAVINHGFRVLLPREWQHIATSWDSPYVFFVDSTSREWLASRVSLVVHTGNLESAKLALQHGQPSIIVAETEDQRKLGLTIAEFGAGASPLALQTLTAEALTQAITYCLRPDIHQAARAIQNQLIDEGGAESAVQSFYRWLPPAQKQVCPMTQQDLTVFRVWNKLSLLISAEAAVVLLGEKKISLSDLVLLVLRGRTTKEYMNGFNTAVKEIVSASNLVGKLSGSRKKVNMLDENGGAYNDGGKSNPARDIGVGTAKFFGHIALLPFTSTALVVNSAIYAAKSVQAHISHDDKDDFSVTEASYDVRSAASYMNAAGQRALEDWPGGSTAIDQLQLRNDEHLLAIFQRYLDRGAQNERIQDRKFRQEVLDAFQISWKRKDRALGPDGGRGPIGE